MAHEPAIQFATKQSIRCLACRNILDKGIDFIQSTACCCNVTIGHLVIMMNVTDNVPFKKRMPDKTQQVFLVVASR